MKKKKLHQKWGNCNKRCFFLNACQHFNTQADTSRPPSSNTDGIGRQKEKESTELDKIKVSDDKKFMLRYRKSKI